MKNLRHAFLHYGINNKQVHFHECDRHIKRDIHVKKNKWKYCIFQLSFTVCLKMNNFFYHGLYH